MLYFLSHSLAIKPKSNSFIINFVLFMPRLTLTCWLIRNMIDLKSLYTTWSGLAFHSTPWVTFVASDDAVYLDKI